MCACPKTDGQDICMMFPSHWQDGLLYKTDMDVDAAGPVDGTVEQATSSSETMFW